MKSLQSQDLVPEEQGKHDDEKRDAEDYTAAAEKLEEWADEAEKEMEQYTGDSRTLDQAARLQDQANWYRNAALRLRDAA